MSIRVSISMPVWHTVVRVLLLVAAVVSSGVADAAAAAKKADRPAFTLVIDAGHGGHDHGAVEGKAREKEINLGVALGFGSLVEKNMPDVRVVYTRKGDYYKSLQERADIANAAKGDLFVSVHTNSVARKARNRRTIAGASTYALGLHRSDENFEVAKRENSVMMLDEDYEATYCGFDPESTESYIIFELSHDRHLDQSLDFASRVQRRMVSTAGRVDKGVRQAGFWVLAKTGMPAVLVELDFICNPASARFLTSKTGQEKMSRALYQAFADYKKAYDLRGGREKCDDSTQAGAKTESEGTVTPQRDSAVDDSAGELRYAVQFLTSETELRASDPRLKKVDNPGSYMQGALYKYYTGSHRTLAQAQRHLRQVRRDFPDAFIIKMRGGSRVP